MSTKKKTPAWVWLGCGCLLLIVLFVSLVGGAGFWGWSQFKSMVDDLADPLARDEATMRMLGAEKLPEGWHSHVFFQIPFIMKIAMLTDGELGEAIEGGFEEKANALENMRLRREDIDRNFFLYFKIMGRGDESLEDLLVGNTNLSGDRRTETKVDLDISIEPGESLNEGTLEIGEQAIEWRAQTGTMEIVGGTLEGIYTAASIRCPGDDNPRDAVWFQAYEGAQPESADSAEASMAAEATAADTAPVDSQMGADGRPEINRTPADPSQVEWLFSHFDLCS